MILFYKLMILQFTAHILADFFFQTQKGSDRKETKQLTIQHLWHAVIIFSASYVLSFHPGFWKAALAIAILHLATDIVKSHFKVSKEKNLFFLDQFIHLLILVLISAVYFRYFQYKLPFDIEIKTIAVVSGLIVCLKPVNIIIKNILDVFEIEVPLQDSYGSEKEMKGLPNAGKLIGITERLLAFVLVLSGQYSAVGLIIAAKSILRFHNTIQAEYVLVGTLLSFAIAILLALGIDML